MRQQYCQTKGSCIKNKSRLNEEKGNAGIRFNELIWPPDTRLRTAAGKQQQRYNNTAAVAAAAALWMHTYIELTP